MKVLVDPHAFIWALLNSYLNLAISASTLRILIYRWAMIFPPCKVAGLLLFAIAGTLTVPLLAQSTDADLKARLIGKPLYLRGCYSAEKLHFDGQGSLIGASKTESFTLSGFDLQSVHFKNQVLTLQGRRVGTEFIDGKPKRIQLDNLKIEIDPPATGDYTAALSAIFADGIKELAPVLPIFWQRWAANTGRADTNGLVSPLPTASAPQPSSTLDPDSSPEKPHTLGGSTTSPVLLPHKEPQFNQAARRMKYSGSSIIRLIVEKDGRPSQVQVDRPLGLGLDEEAVASVQAYKFSPAMQNGDPVRVEVRIAVKFAIF